MHGGPTLGPTESSNRTGNRPCIAATGSQARDRKTQSVPRGGAGGEKWWGRPRPGGCRDDAGWRSSTAAPSYLGRSSSPGEGTPRVAANRFAGGSSFAESNALAGPAVREESREAEQLSRPMHSSACAASATLPTRSQHSSAAQPPQVTSFCHFPTRRKGQDAKLPQCRQNN